MGSTQVYHDPKFLREVWGLFGVGLCIILFRIIVRLRTIGIRQFQGDDYLTIFVRNILQGLHSQNIGTDNSVSRSLAATLPAPSRQVVWFCTAMDSLTSEGLDYLSRRLQLGLY